MSARVVFLTDELEEGEELMITPETTGETQSIPQVQSSPFRLASIKQGPPPQRYHALIRSVPHSLAV